MGTWEPIGRARELLRRCSEEVGDSGRAAVLTSEFVRVLDPTSAMALLDEGQFCRAFAMAATQLARAEPSLWSKAQLTQLADMCFHNGDSGDGDELLDLANREEHEN
jgi:hypothetical protein